ncbi:Protein CBR-SET-29 [Caenorhabditis briggsae]|uniref:Protein CBR-SET-29 n=1 Tax=Caenorhabditis briggsae TaxID=6238 RepID=A8XLD8_CAEBR|nr:Protein CBR-SET-29 [Caenorhabditis briggsae]CAP33463.2 Protein CBR-SET-29 [Caenorhabditis briggsae]
MNEFIGWCKARGYKFDGLEITCPPGNCGNGIYSTTTFRAGRPIITLPEYDMINSALVVDLPFYRKKMAKFTEKLKPMEILTMFFCFEDFETSAWSPYLKVLPKEFDTPAFKGIDYDVNTLPLSIRKFWVDQKKEISEISEKVGDHYEVRKKIVFQLRRLFPELTHDKILWAWHVVNTRCIFVENEEHDNVDNSDGDTIAVIPYVDMLNHDPQKYQGVAIHEKRNGRYVVQAKRQIMEGEQVFVCYGAHDNARLLVEYGFTLPNNLGAKVLIPQEVLLTLAKIAGIAVTREHEMVLEEVGLPSHLYATDEGPSWSLRTNVRVMLLEHWQMANGRWKKIIYSHDPIDEEVDQKIDEKLEIMLKELRNGVVEKTKKMPKDVQWMWEEQVKVCDVAIESFGTNDSSQKPRSPVEKGEDKEKGSEE